MNTTFLKSLRDLEIASLNPHFAHLKFESYTRSLEYYIRIRLIQALDSICTHPGQSTVDPLMMTPPKALERLHVGDGTMLPESLSPARRTMNRCTTGLLRTEPRYDHAISIVEVGGKPWDLAVG